MSGQLSFFSHGVGPPLLEHAEGLLCGPGQAARRGDEARLSVVLPGGPGQEWRAVELERLAAEVALEADLVATAGGGVALRTSFDARLAPLVAGWQRGASKRAPVALSLDGGRLRWWMVSAGRPDGSAYALGLGASDEDAWAGIGAALAAAGLTATLVGPRAEGPAYRITGRRRLARLAELVGEPPPGLQAPTWPGG